MLFNSYAFLLGFFPVTFAVFFLLGRRHHTLAAAWLALASLFFYGYWSAAALPLLVGSICANYWLGLAVTPDAAGGRARPRWRLIAAVALNLAVLAWFKYVNFFVDNVNLALHALSLPELRVLDVVLPIGISFFTFTQIAFLVDCWEGKVRERSFVHYLLFVSYFPHLISGPVLHHSQMMPQFRDPGTYRLQTGNMLTGALFVVIGLAKKALLADEFSQYASPVFNAARDGHELGFAVAWTGALAYTLQIYFDFSGYTDMAIGLSRMLGIRLPLNFAAPYKSTSIIEFWRRWHITLSNFLRDYLYFRLGGNRRGAARRYLNLMITMLLGGLWHGASWTFVVWGALHGGYLLVNHAWRGAVHGRPAPGSAAAALGRLGAGALTFLAVVVAWVFFRAASFGAAARVLAGMTHVEPVRCAGDCVATIFGGIAVPPTSLAYLLAFFGCGSALVWLFPTSQSLAERAADARGDAAVFLVGLLAFFTALLAIINASHHTSEFIYFNF